MGVRRGSSRRRTKRHGLVEKGGPASPQKKHTVTLIAAPKRGESKYFGLSNRFLQQGTGHALGSGKMRG